MTDLVSTSVMGGITAERQKLIEVVSQLPDEMLSELAEFLDYLHDKSSQQDGHQNVTNPFLVTIAALGGSDETDISERDEAILSQEVDSIYGWNIEHKATQ